MNQTRNNMLAKYQSLSLPGKLIAINSVIWLAIQALRAVCWLFTGDDLPWQMVLALNAEPEVFLQRPWTLLTYFFVHANLGDNIFHILFNMIWLGWFGQFFLRYHTGRQLLGVYILGGLTAGLFFLFSFNVFPSLRAMPFATVVGASGAIFALVTAVAMRQPDEAIYLNFFVKVIPIRMKWFALAALLINIMDFRSGNNVGGIVCHLGGMAFGAAFGLAERRGIDLTRHFNQLCDTIADLFKRRPKMQASRGGTRHVPNDRRQDHDYNQRQQEQQRRIDAILDKISKNGYDGLTAEEKAELFSASSRRKH